MEALNNLEISLSRLLEVPNDYELVRDVRLNIVNVLSEWSNTDISHDCNFDSSIKLASKDNSLQRKYALLLLRCYSVPNALPDNSELPGIEVQISNFIINALPDFDKEYKFGVKRQTYESIQILKSVHSSILDQLHIVKFVQNNVKDILARREEILKILNYRIVKAYLQPYMIQVHLIDIKNILSRLDNVNSCSDYEFSGCISQAKNTINGILEKTIKNHDFFSTNYLLSFYKSAQESITTVENESVDRFNCELITKNKGVELADKKYPLHITDRVQKVHITMINTGPGIAKSVMAQITCDSESVLLNEEIFVGDVEAGEFPFSFDILIVEPVNQLELVVDFAWEAVNSRERQHTSLDLKILAQDKDIEWDQKEYLEPYSTEAAEGDEFVGRKSSVAALISRARKSKIQSSYITGQKRVGKTSLAKAVLDKLEGNDLTSNIRSLYLEWGDIASHTPEDALEQLGLFISNFLCDFLPDEISTPDYSFRGSLAPISNILQALAKYRPDMRFMIVIDEFDEIPESLYRIGALAETFFSNLRAISSKKNIAFMLVGGEKMPFIISAQGDQLNKFIREPLEFFTIDEYEDYKDLLQKPTEDYLTWKPDAVEYLFRITNGHAYYTKLIASYIYNDSVSNKDAQISKRDASRVVNKCLLNLDVNAFAHFWKDGIQGSSEGAEIVALNRCRVLVAIGRVMRANLPATLDNIVKHNHSINLKDHEIRPPPLSG